MIRSRGAVARIGGAALLAAVLAAWAPQAALADGRVATAAGAAVPATMTFDVATAAVGVAVASTQRPATSVITADLVDESTSYLTTALSSQGAAEALAAAFYPGNLVVNGPALLCSTFFPCPAAPPSYPLLAEAAYPDRPQARADPTGAGLGSATATAGASQVSANAQFGGSGAAVHVGSATATSNAWADASGAHARTVSALQDVSYGPLSIAGLRASDSVDVTPAGSVTDAAQTTVTGVSVAGIPATVDAAGVHAIAPASAGPLASALAAAGITAILPGATREDTAGAARSDAAGLRLTVTVPVTGAPVLPGVPSANRAYLASVTLGGAGSAVSAGSYTPYSGGAVAPAPPAAAPNSSAAGLPTVGDGSPTLGAAAPALAAAPPAAAAVTASAAGRRSVSFLSDVVSLRTLAAALAVLPLLLLGGWRWRVGRTQQER